ncbi:MAG TPA: lysophospholipid acyltransferase family protein [Caulobacteraceae bacterium]|nr:lysophospholipid acyltransferase family protein [Caulobacteraceae bacterium]
MMSRKQPWWEDSVWRLQALAYDVLLFLIRLLPIDAVSGLGGWLLRTFGPLSAPHRTARINIDIAFPDAPAEWKKKLLADQWENVGRTFFELPILDRITADKARVEVVNGERLDQIRESGRAVVFISGHFASWEVMPAVIVQRGVDCLITYRAQNNPYVDRRVVESRFRYGVRLFAPKGESARELMEGMAEGKSVALMNDQKFNSGLSAPLFGVPAMTAIGPTRYALRFDTVLQPMSVQRLHGAYFRVVVHDPIELAHTGDRKADVAAGVAKINAFMEERIRERPAEWFWVHRRWPKDIYRRDKPGSP